MLGLQAASGPKKAISSLLEANSHAELAITYLHEVGKSWEFGDRLADILTGVKNNRLAPVMNLSSPSTTAATRATQPIAIPRRAGMQTEISLQDEQLGLDYPLLNVTPEDDFDMEGFLRELGIPMAGPVGVYTPYSGDSAPFPQNSVYQNLNLVGSDSV
jgi:hypothetical protein